MSINLLSQLQNSLDSNTIGKLANLVGGNATTTKAAIGTILPRLMGGLSEKASSLSGAESLLGMIKDGNYNVDTTNPSSILGGGRETTAHLDSGKSIVSSLFGNKSESMVKTLSNATNLESGGTSKLMYALAPMLMGTVGKAVANNKLDATGLQNLMSDQTVAMATSSTASTEKIKRNTTQESSGGGGFMKFLLPLLLLLLGFVGYKFFMKKDGAIVEKTEIISETTQNETSYTDDEKASMNRDASNDAMYSMDANGNLVDKDGNIVAKAGEFTRSSDGVIKDKSGKIISSAASISSAAKTLDGKGTAPDMTNTATTREVGFFVDKKGNLVDADGKISFKAGEFMEKDGYYVDKDGNKLGKMLGKIGEAIKGAAEDVAGAVGKGAEAFAGAFTSLFSKKDKVGSTYTLQQIDFNKENHRIEKFSKAEVEALAAALKGNPDSKIQVQVHTNDAGDDSKENQKLSKLRAKVVEDMLITLGVNKSQISAKGMGSENSSKATRERVEIMVEQ